MHRFAFNFQSISGRDALAVCLAGWSDPLLQQYPSFGHAWQLCSVLWQEIFPGTDSTSRRGGSVRCE